MSDSSAALEKALANATVSDQPESTTYNIDPAADQPESATDPDPSLNTEPNVTLDADPDVAMSQAEAATDMTILPMNAEVAVAGGSDEKKAAARKLADQLNQELVDKPAFTTEWKNGEPQNKPGVKLNDTPTNVLIL